MSFNSEITAKILFLANLQRNLVQIQNHTVTEKKPTEGNNMTASSIGQQLMHPLLMPSLNVSSQKISAMLAALTPTSQQSSASHAVSNNNAVNVPMTSSPTNMRSNGSSFGWGNRERKMEENWRMQNRSIK